ncbi:hypothetical protein C4572_00440 [Candidatus Parcubacteria bacterium]|nr:MAG: hypothetical protein C4572_00440 [Candidatus Parcubacteria bacterium]
MKRENMYCVSGNFLLLIHSSENLKCHEKAPRLAAEVNCKDLRFSALILPTRKEAEKFVGMYVKSLGLKITRRLCVNDNIHLTMERTHESGIWIEYRMSICKIDSQPAEKWQEVIDIAAKYIENGFRCK